jgi:tetratricopeptide (TPR) repeat protein
MKWFGWPLALALYVGLIASASAQTLDEVRDQGILYFKKEIYKQAQEHLDRAYKMKGGKTDFSTVYYRAQTHYKLLRLETAFEMVTAALTLAEGDEKRLQRVKELNAEMRGLYGGVTFKAAKGETNKQGRIFFEAKTGIINKEKKERFESIRERFRSTDIELPTTVYLPYGEYLANKVPFAVAQEDAAPPEVEIFLQVVVDAGGEDEGMGTWFWVGVGGAAVAAAGVTALLILGGDDASPPPDKIGFTIREMTVRP